MKIAKRVNNYIYQRIGKNRTKKKDKKIKRQARLSMFTKHLQDVHTHYREL